MDKMPAEHIGKESDAKEKFTAFIWVSQGREVGPDFIGLLSYCVFHNKSEGCELDRQPLPQAFIRHLLLLKWRKCLKTGGWISADCPDHILSQINTRQFDRCARC